MFENQFSKNRVPAFQNLGTSFDQPVHAAEAFNTMGAYTVEREALYYQLRKQGFQPDEHGYCFDPTYKEVPHKSVLVGRFSKEGEQDKRYTYGIVDDRYDLVTPQQLVTMWDLLIQRPVDTIGTLQQGKRFFITAKLDSFKVLDDEYDTYLSLISPHGTSESMICMISPVRLWCMNMLHMAIGASQQYARIPHRKGVTAKVGDWLQEQNLSVISRTTEIQERLTVLANHKVSYVDMENFLEGVFPYKNGDDDLSTEYSEKAEEARQDVIELYEGKGRGSDTEAFKGTAYGLYQSVVEYCDYHKKGATKTGRFVGANAKIKAAAFDFLSKLAA